MDENEKYIETLKKLRAGEPVSQADFVAWFESPVGYFRPYNGEPIESIRSGINAQQDQAMANDPSGFMEFASVPLTFAGLAAGAGGISSLLGGAGAAGGAGTGGWASLGGGVDPGTSILGGDGLTASLVEANAPNTFLGSNAEFTGDWATQGGGVDPSTWEMGGADGGQYANWATQGAGVDPGTTVFPGSGGDGSILGKIGDWLGKVTPGQWLNLGGSALGAGLGYFGANKVANAQEKAASDQQGLLKYMYDQNRADLAPWRQAGVGALGNLVNLTTPGKQFDQMSLDPGYQFRLSQGEQGINRAAASRGGYDSGGTLKALQRFGQDYASNEFGNVYNRNANLAGLGQTAVGQGVQAGQNYGQQAGESMLQAGNARASGYMGGANAIAGGIGSFLNNYNEQTLLDKLLKAKYGA